MPLVRIVQNYPNTNGWKESDIVDCTNPWSLIKEGKAVLVDAEGNEIPQQSKVLQCPVCIYIGTDIVDLANHLLSHQKSKKVVVEEKVELAAVPVKIAEPEISEVAEVVKEIPKKAYRDMTPEEQKTWRLENLKKAREIAKARKEAAKKVVEDESV